jgi:hypothetical protein
MTIEPLRGFGLGTLLTALFVWAMLFTYANKITAFYGRVERMQIAIAITRVLIFVIMCTIGGVIAGVLLNIHARFPISPGSWIPVIEGTFGLGIGIPALTYITSIKPRVTRMQEGSQ